MWPFKRRRERRNASPSSEDHWSPMALDSSLPTSSGARVTQDTALTSSGVFRAVSVLSNMLAMLPLSVVEKSGATRTRLPQHPVARLLSAPNPRMTGFELRRALWAHVALRGNAYMSIVRDSSGRPVQLWPLRPDRMDVRVANGRLVYAYTLPGDGMPRILFADEVLHVRALTNDGVVGYSPLRVARESLGKALAVDEYASRFFGNAARPSGYLKHPGRLEPAGRKNLKQSWEAAHRGLSHAHRVAVLEEGIEYVRIGVAPEEAQWLQSMKAGLGDISRWFEVPLHYLSELSDAHFANVESLNTVFVQTTLQPRAVSFERRAESDLLTAAERESGLTIQHHFQALLRGDIATRTAFYVAGRQWGWFSVNDIRAHEDMNPIEGGDEYLVPLNMVPSDAPMPEEPRSELQSLEQRNEARNVGERQRLAKSFRPVFEDAAARLLRRERADIMRGLKKAIGPEARQRFVEDFYDDHGEFAGKVLGPIVHSYASAVETTASEGRQAEAFVAGYGAALVSRWIEASRAGVLEDVSEEDWPETLDERFEHWEEKRPAQFASRETVRGVNALAILFWGAAGVKAYRWFAVGKDCPMCKRLDGKVVGMGGSFLSAGDTIKEGDRPVLKASRPVKHPPLHAGCDCMVMAE